MSFLKLCRRPTRALTYESEENDEKNFFQAVSKARAHRPCKTSDLETLRREQRATASDAAGYLTLLGSENCPSTRLGATCWKALAPDQDRVMQ